MDAERIPDDIKKAAWRVVERGYNEGLIEAVEKALLAERERCAKIAETHRGYGDTAEQAAGMQPIGSRIAAAIRVPHPA